MKKAILILILLIYSVAWAGTQDFVNCDVIRVKQDVVYFDAGSLLGVAPGEPFEILYDEMTVVTGTIEWADKYISRSAPLDETSIASIYFSEGLKARISLFAAQANQGGTLTIPYFNDLDLEPSEIETPEEKMVGRLIHRGLLTKDIEGDIIPDLAGSFEVRGLTYTFYIDPEASFHSGKAVEASDIEYSLETLALSPKLTSASCFILMVKGAEEFRHRMRNEISGIFLINTKTISITLKEPFPAFEEYLAGPGGYIIPRPGLEVPGGNVIGAGIYRINWRNPDGLSLVPFSDDRANTFLDSLEFVRYKSVDEASLSFELGNVDLLTTLGEPPPKFISGDKNASMVTKTICSAVLGVNGLRDFQKNLNFSKGLTYLLDRETIIRVILGGSAQIPEDLKIGYGDDRAHVNPDSSRYYFGKIDKMPSSVSLLIDSNYPSLMKVARYITGQLQNKGIKVVEKRVDLGELEDERSRSDIDMYLNYFNPVSADPDCELYPLYSYSLSGQTNYLFYKDEALQTFSDKMRRETDSDRREALAAGIMHSLVKEPPAVILYEPYLTTVYKSDITGIRPLKEGYLDLRGAFIESGK